MKNLNSVFAAYLIAWAIFFVYFVSVARRTAALREDLERLKSAMKTSASNRSMPSRSESSNRGQ